MLKKQFSKSNPTAKVTFTLAKDAIVNAKEVRVVGEFNNWNWESAPTMKTTKNGLSTVIELATGKEYQFRYLGDNGVWENDYAADNYVAAPYDVDNSVVVVPAAKGKGTSKADTTTVQKASAKKPVAKKATVTKKATAKKVTAKKVTAKKVTAKKVTAKKVVKVKADDLKKIEGIGPKIAGLLIDAGIATFADVAKASAPKLKKILVAAGSRYQMHDPKTWPAQAKLAAKGDWTLLKSWQDQLKGGK